MIIEWYLKGGLVQDNGYRTVTIPDEDLEGLNAIQRSVLISRTIQGAFFESDIVFDWSEVPPATNETGGK